MENLNFMYKNLSSVVENVLKKRIAIEVKQKYNIHIIHIKIL